jgi:hypothetical protein
VHVRLQVCACVKCVLLSSYLPRLTRLGVASLRLVARARRVVRLQVARRAALRRVALADCKGARRKRAAALVRVALAFSKETHVRRLDFQALAGGALANRRALLIRNAAVCLTAWGGAARHSHSPEVCVRAGVAGERRARRASSTLLRRARLRLRARALCSALQLHYGRVRFCVRKCVEQGAVIRTSEARYLPARLWGTACPRCCTRLPSTCRRTCTRGKPRSHTELSSVHGCNTTR